MSQKNDLSRGYSIALLSAVVLSTTAVLVRYLTETYHIPALLLAFWRDLFAALALAAVLVIFRRRLLRVTGPQLIFLAFYGVLLSVFNATWTLSVALNGAAISNVLVYSSTGFTALLGWWFLKERLTWAKAAAVVFCLGGCVLVSQALDPAAWLANMLGILTGALSGLCYAIYSLMGRSAARRGLSPWTTLLYGFVFAMLALLALNLLPVGLPGTISNPTEVIWMRDGWAGWGVLFLLAAGPTLVGYGLYNVSLQHLPSSTANLIVSIEPVITVVIAFLWLGERMTWVQVLGSLAILSGVGLLRLFEGRSERADSAQSARLAHSES